MFIECANSMIINLDKVRYIKKDGECYIKFYYSNDESSFECYTKEERDEFFEKIRKLLNAVEI